MKWHHWAFLLAAGTSALPAGGAHANTDTTRVRDSTLLSMRRALSHYDVSPCATAAQLALLAQYAEEHNGQPEAEEARFLRAAVASDLAFVAQLKGNTDLNAAVAQNFGGDPTQLTARIEQALQEVARGIYKEPAQLAIKVLRDSGEQPNAAPGPRSDALLLRRAIAEAKTPNPRERYAALGQDPCANQAQCSEELSALDAESRKSLWYLGKVSEAEKRLENAAKLGDQLAEAVVPILREARRDVALAPVQFLPDLTKTTALPWPGNTRVAPASELHAILFVSGTELSYSTLQQARIGLDAITLEHPDTAFPKRTKLADVQQKGATVKPISEWVSAFEQLKGQTSNWSVGVVPAAGTPAHLLSRVLVSLAQAGAQTTPLLARTASGQLTSVPTHVVFAGLRDAQYPVDLNLRVRMSGYVLRMGESETELGRVTEGGQSRYDVAGLGRALSRRRFQTVGLSFVADVTAENLFDALAQLPPGEHAVQMLLRSQL